MFLARMAELSALFLWQEPEQEDTPLKDFFDTWKFKILVAVAVFLVGIMAYAGANGRLTAAPQELLSVSEGDFGPERRHRFGVGKIHQHR